MSNSLCSRLLIRAGQYRHKLIAGVLRRVQVHNILGPLTAWAGDVMTITKTIATTIAAFALLTTSALAADIVRKAPIKGRAGPAAAMRSRLRRRRPERLQFPWHFADRQGPGRLRLRGAALQSASEHRALRRHLGLEHQAPDQPDRRIRPLWRHPARPSARSRSISASCTTGTRARRSSGSPMPR